MNLYIVVEGEIGEKYVYENWIPWVNPSLSKVNSLENIKTDNFYIIAGFGYPSYFDVICNAINDVNENLNIDRLVVSVDSEDQTFDEKYNELQTFIEGRDCRTPIHIIVQHFCLETWALGNKKVGPRNPKHPQLVEFKKFFNVLDKDPEDLPNYPPLGFNRAIFAERYLRRMLNDKHRNLTYSKHNPKALLNNKYYNEVKKRFDDLAHIKSFQTFIDAFI